MIEGKRKMMSKHGFAVAHHRYAALDAVTVMRSILTNRVLVPLTVVFVVLVRVQAQVDSFDLWREVDESQARARLPMALRAAAERDIVPQVYRTLAVNQVAMEQLLSAAPVESTNRSRPSGSKILLPLPQGGYGRFSVVESPLLEPTLAAQFPKIKNYILQGIDDPTASGRIDTGPRGFRAMVISADETFFIDPYWSNSNELSICYARKDFTADDKTQEWSCGVVYDGLTTTPDARSATAQAHAATGANLRIYRAAIAATGEYTAFHGGTVEGALAAINTTLARVNSVFERELCIRMVLVGNNASIIFTNATTDGYSNNDGEAMLSQNQTKLDSIIGNANYDIGHVFSTGGGGIASLGSVCVTGLKAQGVTGSSRPVGDPFDVDYVAHEIGHQFSANHTFNGISGSCGGGNRNAPTAFEPGSGSTIMAYAGICSPQNLQNNSDDYFHVGSYAEIYRFITTGAAAAAFSNIPTANNLPVITQPVNDARFVIPARTAFSLNASATDPDGDSLTFCWEQYDTGPAQGGAVLVDNGSIPIFRSYRPTTNATRLFPSLQYILSNSNFPPTGAGEAIPTTSRTMAYRVSVRDNRAGGGGQVAAGMQVTTISNAGPFRITSPNVWTNLTAGTPFNLSWDVASTTAAPISASKVRVSLSTNGGTNFPVILAASLPNNGLASVTVPPGVATTNGRLRVEAVGNIFFDVNDANLTVTSATPPAPVIVAAGNELLEEECPTGALDPGELVTASFGLRNASGLTAANVTARLLDGDGIIAVTTNAVNYGALEVGGAAVTRHFEFLADASCGSVVTAVFEIRDGTTMLGLVPFDFVVGAPNDSTAVFSNSSSITIRDRTSASPYPSSVNITGLPEEAIVRKATVTLHGLTHGRVYDVDIILVSPSGKKTMLMSYVGEGPVDNVDLTFDDAAAAFLPYIGQVVTGTYQPTSFSSSSLPSPAPGAPYASALREFVGAKANGTWALYVADSATGSTGSIARGWSLSITTDAIMCCDVVPAITSPLSATGEVGKAFAYQIASTGAPVLFGASELPSGLSIDAASGLISGTPLVAGTINVTISATNGSGETGFSVLAISISGVGPSIQTTGQLVPLASIYGQPSDPAGSLTVAGEKLTDGISISAPRGFEVSQTPGGGSGYASSQLVDGSGTIGPVTVYVRLAAGVAVGSYTGDLIFTSSGATPVNVTAPESVVGPAVLSIKASDQIKPYGQTLVLGEGQTAFAASGLIGSDVIETVSLHALGGADMYDDAGNYEIIPSAPVGENFDVDNYDITYLAGSLTVQGDSGPQSDPDHDGLPNLVEKFMGLSPAAHDSSGALTYGSSAGLVHMDYRRRKPAGALLGSVTWKANLQNSDSWSTNGVVDNLLSDEGTFELRRAIVPILPGETRKFLRLEVREN